MGSLKGPQGDVKTQDGHHGIEGDCGGALEGPSFKGSCRIRAASGVTRATRGLRGHRDCRELRGTLKSHWGPQVARRGHMGLVGWFARVLQSRAA